MKDESVNQTFFTNDFGFIYKTRFCTNGKFHFPPKIYEMAKMLRDKIVYMKEIYKFGVDHFFIGVTFFVY